MITMTFLLNHIGSLFTTSSKPRKLPRFETLRELSQAETELFDACRSGNSAKVKTILSNSKSDLNLSNAYEPVRAANVLYVAVQHQSLPIVRMLLESGLIDVDDRDRFGWTALNLASFIGDFDTVRMLVEDGRANMAIANSCERQIPLHSAIRQRHYDIAAYLAAKMSSRGECFCDSYRDLFHTTPFMLACQSGDIKLLEILLKPTENHRAKALNDALIESCRFRKFQAARLILDYFGPGCHISNQSAHNRYDSALFHAIRAHKIDLIKIMLTKGERLDVSSVLSTTSEPNLWPMAKFLIEQGADLPKPADFICPFLFNNNPNRNAIYRFLLQPYIFAGGFKNSALIARIVANMRSSDVAEVMLTLCWPNDLTFSHETWFQMIIDDYPNNQSSVEWMLSNDFRRKLFPPKLQSLARKAILRNMPERNPQRIQAVESLNELLPQQLVDYVSLHLLN